MAVQTRTWDSWDVRFHKLITASLFICIDDYLELHSLLPRLPFTRCVMSVALSPVHFLIHLLMFGFLDCVSPAPHAGAQGPGGASSQALGARVWGNQSLQQYYPHNGVLPPKLGPLASLRGFDMESSFTWGGALVGVGAAETYIHTYIHACMHAYIHTHVCTHIYIYIYVYMQNYMICIS